MRILIADDHPLFLEAIKMQIERAIPGAQIQLAKSLGEVAEIIARTADFSVLLLDFSMPGMEGVTGIERLRRSHPSIPIVIMSGMASAADAIAAIRAGANGFLPKTLGGAVFIGALNVVLAGGTYLPADVVLGTSATAGTAALPDQPVAAAKNLTPREVQVLQAIVRGQTNKEIGRELGLQEVTVKLHARRIFAKLGVGNRAGATAAAFEQKLVKREAF